MASFLYRLGRAAFDRRRVTIALWAFVLAVVGVSALSLLQPTATTFSLPGTESQRALDVLSEQFPALGADGATARVVVEVPSGQRITTPDNAAKLETIVKALSGVPQVATVADPLQVKAISLDQRAAYIQVGFEVPATQVTTAMRDALKAVADDGRAQGLTVEVGGDALAVPTLVGGEEVVGVLVAAVVLAITLGSLVAAGLPLLTALIGIGIGLSGIGIVTHFVTLSSFTPVLALMLGLAVAIDYSLFIVSRYRHELATGSEPRDAAGRAVATSGAAVLFAGSTVVIALVSLAVVNIPILTEIGLAAAFTVAISVLVALTLLPAIVGFLGRRLSPSVDPEADAGRPGFLVRWARFLTGHPIPVVAVAVAALLVIAVPALDMRLGLPDDSSASPSTTQRKAYDLISAKFSPGVNGPLLVVVDASGSADPVAAGTQAAATVARLPDVLYVSQAMPDSTGKYALLQVIPGTGPSSAETETLVAAIRAASSGLQAQTGATLAVTGRTALNIDMSARMGDALVPYLVIVVGLTIVLLTIVFRSILLPVKAALGFVLSLAATLGALVAVFQWGWLGAVFGVGATGPILSLLPMLVVAIVFGLAMDYEVFLVTRMREEHALGADPTAAVVTGFAHGARVVAAAAIIMISVFGGFVLSGDALIKSAGFALAAAVLFDAFVVRLTIVPAVVAVAGKAAWWLPGWLARLLPDVGVGGREVEPDRTSDQLPVSAQTREG
jgi:RND superfamily putative drug exporter